MFRHEHRLMRQLHRHHYTPALYKFELLNRHDDELLTLIAAHSMMPKRLSVFQKIHKAYDDKKLLEKDQAFQQASTTEESGSDLSDGDFFGSGSTNQTVPKTIDELQELKFPTLRNSRTFESEKPTNRQFTKKKYAIESGIKKFRRVTQVSP